LTRQQYEAVSGVLGNPRVRIEGVAGSGKTLIALWAAREFADAGKRVLLCCFNKGLSAWLREEMSSSPAVVDHFHAMADAFCKKAGMALPNDRNSPAFWEDVVPIQLMDAIDFLGNTAKFDVILVDEAQDFHANWWTPLEMMLKDNTSSLYMFLDLEQSGIYGKETVFPCTGLTYALSRNCRNSQLITKASGFVVGREIPSKTGMPEGAEPVFLKTEPDREKRTLLLKKQVNKLFNEGYEPGDIAILSPWSRTNPKCSVFTVINNIQVNDDVLSWKRGECLLGSTIKAFKGLDAKCVIITDVPAYCSPGFTETDLYVGVTRAKHALYLIPMADVVRSYLVG
jgi:superfamily I DNA/RNA helicase